MSQTEHLHRGNLYIIACAAPPARNVQGLVKLAQAAGWNVCLIATPQSLKFLNVPLLEQLTGYPVRSNYKHPDEPDILPRADAILVFPATFNTINKWALGITDTLALGLLCEYLGLGKPILAAPSVTVDELGRHPVFFKNIATLREWGIHVLYEPELYPRSSKVPLPVVLDALNVLVDKHAHERDANVSST